MKKVLLLLILSSNLKAQNAQTTYTLTPYQNGASVYVSTALTTSSGQTVDYPTNSLYPEFSKDSVRVQWFNVYNKQALVIATSDSISHFYTGSFHFTKVKSIDSFFHCCMTK